MKTSLVVSLLLAASTVAAQNPPTGGGGGGGGRQLTDAERAAMARNRGGGQCARNAWNCVDAKNPLPAPNTVWLEEMTWMDVRDAVAAGKTTVIIATGGMEPNGPFLVTGKHNYVLQANCEAIARKMGNALCAPIVKFVPEGRIEPPSGHMTSAGTISMREETFRAMLTDIAASLKQHGFTQIFYIGDSGGNQNGQRYVADSLNKAWGGSALVAHIQEYYDYAKVSGFMESHGIKEDSTKQDNLHDDPIITLNMYITDPKSVRFEERKKAGLATINGVSVADKKKNDKLAKEIVDFRATTTIEAINKAIANKGTLPAPPRRQPTP
jgi:creatinine amidohydrolase/Fe(II)-dependent formamide hydrolase-like protein